MNHQENYWIVHVDGDAFFASCEVIRKPELWGKPVVVGFERGIVTALTYEAKALGVKRGDPIFKIKKEYKNVKILSSHFELYAKYAESLQDILKPFVCEFEAYSIDECFFSLRGNKEEIREKVLYLRELIHRKLGVTYSFGVSVNKTLAKVASKRNKPKGVCFLFDKEEIEEALRTTKVENIWGVGWQTSRRLHNKRILDAYSYSKADGRKVLQDRFTEPVSNTIRELNMERIYGINIDNPHQKSLQSTRTFVNKTNLKKEILSELSRNLEVACGELRERKLYTNRIYFFIKRANESTLSIYNEVYLPFYTNSSIKILRFIEQVFDKYESTLPGIYKKSGVTCSNLKIEEEMSFDLFGEQENILIEENKINSVIDAIRSKYGFESIQIAQSKISIDKRFNELVKREEMDNYEYGLPFAYLGEIR